jgi:hypothetical protein
MGHLAIATCPTKARYITSSPVYPPCNDEGACPDIGIVCNDRVEVDVNIELSSDDGAFLENWATILISPSP